MTFRPSSEWGFYRYAQCHLRSFFPNLPSREQFNRLMRHHRDAIVAFFLYLVGQLQAQDCPYEALDSAAVPTHDVKRRGVGWLPGEADIGWSNRLGWYEGFHLLMAVNPVGVITGFGFGPASGSLGMKMAISVPRILPVNMAFLLKLLVIKPIHGVSCITS